MDKLVVATIAVMMFLGVSAPAHAQSAQIFVAPGGNDTNPGTLEKPFATLGRAHQAARKAAGREAVTVFVREGTFYLPETLILTAEDSGTKAAPVVYRAYEKEQAVISGGIRLKDLTWEPYQNGIMKATVSAGDSAATWDHIAHSPCCSIDKAASLLGYRPRYSSLQGVCDSVEWLKLHGWRI